MPFLNALPTGAIDAATLMQQPATPFVWGQGGARVSPDQIARQRELAAQQLGAGMDYSPVGSWTQGLARAAQGVVGALGMKRADKEDAANQAAGDAITQALLSGGSSSGGAVTAALLNPNTSPEARQLAVLQWKDAHRAPQQQPEIVRLAQIANDPTQPEWARSAAQGRVEAMNNPVVSLPGGGLALRSYVTSTLGGGDPASTPSVAPQAGAVEDGFRFKGGDPSDQSNWEPAGSSEDQAGAILSDASGAGSIDPGQAAMIRDALGPNGQAAFQNWLSGHNIKVNQ